MGLGVGSKNHIDPNSRAYLDWYRGINSKLENNQKGPLADKQELYQKPQINPNSNKMMNKKRLGNSYGSNITGFGVHDRLHQAAVAK